MDSRGSGAEEAGDSRQHGAAEEWGDVEPPSFGEPPSSGEPPAAPAAPPAARYAPPLTPPDRYAPPTRQPNTYNPPPITYAPPLSYPCVDIDLHRQDAPLIHPAAARASANTPYGIPVYYVPQSYAPTGAGRSLSITGFVLGLCSVMFSVIMPVLPILGLVFGFIGLRREPAGRTFAIVGIVSSAFAILAVLAAWGIPLVMFFIGLATGA